MDCGVIRGDKGECGRWVSELYGRDNHGIRKFFFFGSFDLCSAHLVLLISSGRSCLGYVVVVSFSGNYKVFLSTKAKKCS